MRLPDEIPDVPLLALVGATAEWQAGVPPSCSASVRLLDCVHFRVHRGDCVVVRHSDPASARVLLAALAGHPALLSTTAWGGRRQCAPQVRVRRCAVRAEVVASLLEGWQASGDATPCDPLAAEVTPVVHLLRASRDGYVTRDDGRQWRHWAQGVRARGGAVVVVARAGEVGALPAVVPVRSARVSEPSHRVTSAVGHPGRVQLARLRHGQLVSEHMPP